MTNSGVWEAVNTNLPAGSVLALAVDPKNHLTLYAGTNGSGIFKSTDGAGSWNPINADLTDPTVSAIVINAIRVDPVNSAVLYVGTGLGVFRSTNSGEKWDPFNTGLPVISVLSLAIDPTRPQTLYAGTFAAGAYTTFPELNDRLFLPLIGK